MGVANPVYLSVLFAIVITVTAVILVRWKIKSIPWFDRMGASKWDFKESWASTFTAVGAILGTALSESQIFPEQTQRFTKAEYVGLNLLFAGLTVVAAFVHSATRLPVEVGVPSDTPGQPPKKETQYQGFVVSFLLASALTLWAVSGQIIVVFALVGEMLSQGLLPLVSSLVRLLLVGVGIALIIHAPLSIAWAIEQGRPEPERDRVIDRLGVKVLDFEPRLPEWSML